MTRVSSGTDHQTSTSRYEIKMVFNGLQTGLVRSLIVGHSHLFKKAFPSRQVNNIYFDTQDFQLKDAHIQGDHSRIKIRHRWYHDPWKFSNSQFEIKSKSGNLGSKTVFPIPLEIDLIHITWNDLRALIRPYINQENQHLLMGTNPVLINNYQREYFESADQLIRITLDSRINSLSQVFNGRPNLLRKMPYRNTCILEIKADSAYHQEIASVLAEFPQYCTAYSKYIHGTETLPT